MTEFEQELVKEVLAEAEIAKATVIRSFERLEKLAQRLLKESEKKTEGSDNVSRI
jgi:hypothetical protein